MVFRNFLGNDFFFGRTPPAGNSNLVVFGPILGLWHLEKFQARPEYTKTQLPSARSTFMGGGDVTTLSGMVFCKFFRVTLFFWSDPHRPKIAIQWFSPPFWPISKCPRLRTGQNTKIPITVSDRWGLKKFPRKLRKTIPDSVVEKKLSISGPLLLRGLNRALRG